MRAEAQLHTRMDVRAFEGLTASIWDKIPAELREGVEALEIEEGAPGHPSLGGVYTLGECITESWPTGYGELGDVRSRLVLYHGSFQALADQDAGFAWEDEAWETVLHELLHHREAAAGESSLDELDWATDQNFQRLAGRDFDPTFYRTVPADTEGAVRLDSEIFVEGRRFGGGEARFSWRRREYSVRVPDSPSTLYVEVRNLGGGRLTVVVPPRVGLLRRLLGTGPRSTDQLLRRALPVRAALDE